MFLTKIVEKVKTPLYVQIFFFTKIFTFMR